MAALSVKQSDNSSARTSFTAYIVHLIDQEMYIKEKLQIDETTGKLPSNYKTHVLLQFNSVRESSPPSDKCNICGFLLSNPGNRLDYVEGHSLSDTTWMIVVSTLCGKKKCAKKAEVLVAPFALSFIESLMEMKVLKQAPHKIPQRMVPFRRIICNHCKSIESLGPESIKTFQCCSGCRAVYYCDKKCQKADWVSHKPLCLAYRCNKPQRNKEKDEP